MLEGHGRRPGGVLQDAYDVDALTALPVILTAQGGDYTGRVPEAARRGWDGIWIDAASTCMADTSVIALDPVNRGVIDAALANGTKDFIGGNCTVSPACSWAWVACSRELRPGRVGHRHDLPGGLRRRRPAHARAAHPVRRAGRRGAGELADPASAILEIDLEVIELRSAAAWTRRSSACRWVAR